MKYSDHTMSPVTLICSVMRSPEGGFADVLRYSMTTPRMAYPKHDATTSANASAGKSADAESSARAFTARPSMTTPMALSCS